MRVADVSDALGWSIPSLGQGVAVADPLEQTDDFLHAHEYVPHWNTIINGTPDEAREQASKLLYVVCSRAKGCLHLIAESERNTNRGRPYETTFQLREIRYAYDV